MDEIGGNGLYLFGEFLIANRKHSAQFAKSLSYAYSSAARTNAFRVAPSKIERS